MNCTILQGDALELLRTLPPESVHTCVTSPPYPFKITDISDEWGAVLHGGAMVECKVSLTIEEYL